MILIPTLFFEETYAGWAKFTRRMIPYLEDQNVVVLTFRSELKSDIPHAIIPFDFIRNNRIRSLWFSLYACFFILANRRKVSAVFCPNLYLFSLLIAGVSKLTNSIFTGRVCANELKSFYSRSSTLRIWLAKRFHNIIVLSEASKTEAQTLLGAEVKIEFIPNPVDEFFINKTRKPEEANVLFVGEFIPRKGLKRLLNSCKEAKVNISNLKLTIIGPITDKLYYDELDRFYDFAKSDWITILDKQEKENLLNFYSSSTVFVLPSYSEGMPNVLLEAMAVGVPCIGSRIPGIVENIYHGQTGMLFSGEDFSQELIKLLTHKNLRELISEQGKLFIEAERLPRKVFSIYNNIIFDGTTSNS